MKRALHLAAVLVATFCMAPAAAGTAGAAFTVSIRLIHDSKAEVSRPSTLDVTAEDIARGYVDAQRPMLVSAQTSSPDFPLLLAKVGSHVRRVQVQGPGEAVRFTSDAVLVLPAAGASETWLLRVRFDLSPGLSPGSYPWPLEASRLSM